jgi:hypothetical protein
MSWNDPRRVRRSVHLDNTHLGYVTTIAYPGRDITALTEGLPYSEVVIADPGERHVALLQRFKEHWLVQSGASYGTADAAGELGDAQAMQLALFALTQRGTTRPVLVALLVEQLESMLTG